MIDHIIERPEAKAAFSLGYPNNMHGTYFCVTYPKPCWLHRFLQRILLGIYWYDLDANGRIIRCD